MNQDRRNPRHRNRSIMKQRAVQPLLCSDLIQIRWERAHGSRREEIAIMEDFSPSATSLFMGVPIEIETPVRLCAKGEDFQGVVRYCSVESNGYLVGVQFEASSPKEGGNRSNYQPKHLLDVSRLVLSDQD
jgi:hypothetical protein